ncbi:MAG: glycine cleavage system aminomethyltransferase GcvT [Alphaproteobacteria bacterium]
MNKTALYDFHLSHGGKMVEFAGYQMPVQYPKGIMQEHLHTRALAGLFDVSHMGQVILQGAGLDSALEKLIPTDLSSLSVGQQRYSLLLNAEGGIEDDVMIFRRADSLQLVINAGRKHHDMAWLRQHLPAHMSLTWLQSHSLLALQGKVAIEVVEGLLPAVKNLNFMEGAVFELHGHELLITRSGYTGEDGVEISVPNKFVQELAQLLLADERVALAGLGARDSLRLEAGLCLYGHDIDDNTNPIEAGLLWVISPKRRVAFDFMGGEMIKSAHVNGAGRKRVGLMLKEKGIAREHTPILDKDGTQVGEVTSGGFSPSLQQAIAMGYVLAEKAVIGEELMLEVRGRHLAATICKMPFVQHQYAKKKAA